MPRQITNFFEKNRKKMKQKWNIVKIWLVKFRNLKTHKLLKNAEWNKRIKKMKNNTQ